MTDSKEIFLFGASGHAKVVADIIEKEGRYKISFLVDDDPLLKNSEIYGYRVIGGRNELLDALKGGTQPGIVAIGNNGIRKRISEWLDSQGIARVSAVHPSAQLARGVTIGAGTVIMGGVVINSDTIIGENVIVNTGATIDHDCMVSDTVHIAPGATLCGTVKVGRETFICARSVIIPNVEVGSGVIVGAGSTVLKNISDNVTVAGTPAREIGRNT